MYIQYKNSSRSILKSTLILILFVAGLYGIPSVVSAVTFSTGIKITGNAWVVGAFVKGSGTFAIDHPLDPKNKILYHSFVESPDAKNIYDGVATLNLIGEATIVLPSYFLALNDGTRIRYLATAMGSPMPNLHIEKEVYKRVTWFGLKKEIVFKIAGGTPQGKISWQVTGIRHDPLILANPIIPEVEKGPNQIVNKGECLYKPLCE